MAMTLFCDCFWNNIDISFERKTASFHTLNYVLIHYFSKKKSNSISIHVQFKLSLLLQLNI